MFQAGGLWGHWLVFIIIFVFIVCHLSFTLICHFLDLFLMWVVGTFAAFILVTENRLWSFRRNQCYYAIAGMVHICYWCLKICFSGYGKGKRIMYGVCVAIVFVIFFRNEALLLSAGKKSLFPFKYMYIYVFIFEIFLSHCECVCLCLSSPSPSLPFIHKQVLALLPLLPNKCLFWEWNYLYFTYINVGFTNPPLKGWQCWSRKQ